jgi:hypothetical protein
MNLIGITIVSPFWGVISTQLFLQSWLAFIGAIMSIIGIIMGKVERQKTFMGLGVSVVQMLLFSGLLYGGQYLLADVWGFGFTKTENIVYWVFAGLSLLYMVPQFPAKIKKGWRNATIPGSLEEDIMKRKMGDAGLGV